jgi:phosphonopyruvate decarboxylase
MVSAKDITNSLVKCGIINIVGVPDSVLKSMTPYFDSCFKTHHIATNEGTAVAMAIGQFLATGQPSAVYMQNSGIGNALNPLISLAHKRVYSIPMLLLIGWRGAPGSQDEPQHVSQGLATTKLLNTLDIPYCELSGDADDFRKLTDIVSEMRETSSPRAILFRKEVLKPLHSQSETISEVQLPTLKREEAISAVVDACPVGFKVVSSTGKSSRELAEIRDKQTSELGQDFYCVGGMGHTLGISLGITSVDSTLNGIICLDGDGSLLMHMGSLALVKECANRKTKLIYILLNNFCHESVGGQPSPITNVDSLELFNSVGFEYVKTGVSSQSQIIDEFKRIPVSAQTAAIEIIIGGGSRNDLTRPKKTPLESLAAFMENNKV